MKVLVLNASPNSSKSNTMKLTNAFMEGLNSEEQNKIDVFDLTSQNIEFCKGCKTCWTKTPGECSLNDDMAFILSTYVAADIIVWSFPVNHYGIPARMKNFIDRLLPIYLPYIEKNDNDICTRPLRYNFSNKKYMVISTCDYANTRQNYESVLAQFDLMYGRNYTKILCPEGELFGMPQFVPETRAYLSACRTAGTEFAKTGKFSNKTTHALLELMVEPERFVKISNGNWIVNNDNINSTEFEVDPTEKLVRELVVAYNPKSFRRKIILEIHFTDLNKTYQLYLGRTQCTLKTEIFQMYNTRIEATFDVFSKICKHELSCSDALATSELVGLGEFTNLLRIDDLFGFKEDEVSIVDRRKSFLPSMLLPWVVLWVLGFFAPDVAPLICIALCAGVPALSFSFKTTKYENVTMCCVPILSLFLMLGVPTWIVMLISFVVLGGAFIFSSFRTIPVTAPYIAFAFGGYTALENPIYLSASRVLSAATGLIWLTAAIVISILGAVTTNVIAGFASLAYVLGATLFAFFFMRWYPKKVSQNTISQIKSTKDIIQEAEILEEELEEQAIDEPLLSTVATPIQVTAKPGMSAESIEAMIARPMFSQDATPVPQTHPIASASPMRAAEDTSILAAIAKPIASTISAPINVAETAEPIVEETTIPMAAAIPLSTVPVVEESAIPMAGAAIPLSTVPVVEESAIPMAGAAIPPPPAKTTTPPMASPINSITMATLLADDDDDYKMPGYDYPEFVRPLSRFEKIKQELDERSTEKRRFKEERANQPIITEGPRKGKREKSLAEYKAEQLAKQRRREKMRLPNLSDVKEGVSDFFDNILYR